MSGPGKARAVGDLACEEIESVGFQGVRGTFPRLTVRSGYIPPVSVLPVFF